MAITLISVFVIQWLMAEGMAKLIFPSIFIAINLFMFLALFSEFSEFSQLNREAVVLLVVGTLYLGLNIVSSIYIILKSGNFASDGIKV